jgi:CubicO group peptidase (beta-lactamase class C family)
MECEMAAKSDIDQLLGHPVAQGTLPGVVALAVRADAILYEGAHGLREIGGTAAMSTDTVLGIASMTKAITSVAALQLVESGRLALDAPAASYLPELGEIQVLDGFDAHGVPTWRPPRRPVTLRRLLTHTGGFAYPTWNRDLFRFQQWANTTGRIGELPMAFDPGDRWEYGTNIDWVGRIVERISGENLEAYFRSRILDPLDMLDTSFIVDASRRERAARRYQRQSDGSLRELPISLPERPTTFNGGGGLYSTGRDYARFLQMLLGGGQLAGQRILRSETVAELGRNQIGDLNVNVMHSMNPTASNDAEFFPGMDKKWGLAGFITPFDTRGGRHAGSWAWAGIANTYFWIDPASGVAGVLMTQILPFCDPTVLTLLDGFERAVYASL